MAGTKVLKYRRQALLIQYYQGLISEYKDNLRKKYYVFGYIFTHNLDLKIAMHYKHLYFKSPSQLKVDTTMERYDQKALMKRKAFIQTTKRQGNELSLDEILRNYDQKAMLERQNIYNGLIAKFPPQTLTVEEKSILEKSILNLTDIKVSRLKKIDQKFILVEKRCNNKITKLQNKITKLEEKQKQLFNQMSEHSHGLLDKHKEELLSLNKITEVSNKKISKNILKRISDLKTEIEFEKNHNAHLVVNNLKMFFGGIKAVNDLTFCVEKGELFGLIGPNGAGKTTVFNCITQFYKCTSGSIFFRNKEGRIVNLNSLKTHNIITEGIARSFQNIELVWELSVIDNLLVAAHSQLITNIFDHMIHSNRWKREEKVQRNRAFELLKLLGIEMYAFYPPYGLPYGILKKIELARTLMTNPSFIILDEPAAGLNEVETIDLGNTIKKINKEFGITIFLVEHDMSLVMSITDRICAISFGKLLAIGTPQEIRNNVDVRAAYLGEEDE